jgi:L-ascorbate metabolism protein UlaG (beta-lactamase superfamily)
MDIERLGRTGVRIATGRGTVLVDPEPAGDRLASGMRADIVAYTRSAESGAAAGQPSDDGREAPFVVDGPGEYEVSGLFIIGVQAPSAGGEAATLYTVTDGEVTACHVGRIASLPAQPLLEQLGPVDVLIVPLGETALSAASAAELVGLMEPALVVPLDDAETSGGEHVARFVKEMAADDVELLTLLRVLPNRLPDETEVRLLAPAGQAPA